MPANVKVTGLARLYATGRLTERLAVDDERERKNMATRVKTLDIAIAEAERFLSAAKSFKKGADRFGDEKNPWLEGGALAAYTKRASMDLSRALANIRKGDPFR